MEILRKESGYKLVKGIGFSIFNGILLYENELDYIPENLIYRLDLPDLLNCSSKEFKEKCEKYMEKFEMKKRKAANEIPLIYGF